jgi:hypothetical protein
MLPSLIDAPTAWRKFPFVLLAGGLLLFGIFPNALTRRILPAVTRVAELARPSAVPAATAAPVTAAAVVTPATPASN